MLARQVGPVVIVAFHFSIARILGIGSGCVLCSTLLTRRTFSTGTKYHATVSVVQYIYIFIYLFAEQPSGEKRTGQ